MSAVKPGGHRKASHKATLAVIAELCISPVVGPSRPRRSTAGNSAFESTAASPCAIGDLSLLKASLDVCEGVVRRDLGAVGPRRAVVPPAKGNSQGVAGSTELSANGQWQDLNLRPHVPNVVRYRLRYTPTGPVLYRRPGSASADRRKTTWNR